ncbi:MAG: hypothetical protein GY928_19975 [Colwellia sp.]|nr:hypothetical protein [Colwellia sp.]
MTIQSNDFLNGQWKNSYDSQMFLSVDEYGLMKGVYSSTTGSSGEYYIIGNVCPLAEHTDLSKGRNLVISIYWHSIKDGEPDPTWHWVSTYAGQFMSDGKIYVLNSMVSTTDFPDIEAKIGDYIGPLEFAKVSDQGPQIEIVVPEQSHPEYENQINGQWQVNGANYSTLTLSVKSNLHGWVCGMLDYQGEKVRMLGFTDVHADNILQSITVSGYLPKKKIAISLSGSLNHYDGTKELNLSRWLTRCTTQEDNYLQNDVMPWRLTPGL